ncbi:MAG: hypothetical protein AB8H03_02985 [Saprospiraceae bacterium]
MTKFQTIFLILLSPIFCFAQKIDAKDYVKTLFENQAEIQWIKYYKGRIDDLNDVAITLGFDGVNCKGRLTYLRSNTDFDLNGYIENETLLLQELDQKNNVSGILSGKIAGKTINGNWKNFDGSRGGNLTLTETEKIVKFPSYCGDNKWIRKYQGKIANNNWEILLQKESSDQLTGLVFHKKKNTSYSIKGNVDINNNFTLKAKNQKGQIVETFVGLLKQDQLTIGTKKSKKITLAPFEGLTIGCVEYADYATGYDITFPKTTNAAFNKQMDEETNAWIKACRKHLLKIKKQNTSADPKMRATERGFAWGEVEYFSQSVISGFMTFSNTWTPGQKLIVFNFDMKNDRMLYLEDIFENKKDYQKYIRNYIKKEIKNHQLYADPDFKKWIKKSNFSYFTIRKNGICFSTKYSMLYGRQSVTIPFRQLQPFLKKSFITMMKE